MQRKHVLNKVRAGQNEYSQAHPSRMAVVALPVLIHAKPQVVRDRPEVTASLYQCPKTVYWKQE